MGAGSVAILAWVEIPEVSLRAAVLKPVRSTRMKSVPLEDPKKLNLENRAEGIQQNHRTTLKEPS